MEKYITRTITSYKHTFGIPEVLEDGTVKINVIHEDILPVKLGQRKIKAYIKDNDIPDGAILMPITEVNRKYAVPFDVFMKNAVEVKD